MTSSMLQNCPLGHGFKVEHACTPASSPSTRAHATVFLCSAAVVTSGGADPTLPCFYDCHLCATNAPARCHPAPAEWSNADR